MKSKIFYISILFFLLLSIPSVVYGNVNTREYCEALFKTMDKEHRNKNYVRCIEILMEVKTITEVNNWDDIKIKTLNKLGIIYRNLSDYEKAMEHYLEAYKVVIEISDREMEKTVLNNIASLYHATEEYHKAIEYVQKAYDISVERNDSFAMARIICNLGIAYDYLEEHDLATKYIDESIKIAENMSDTNEFYRIYGIYVGKIQNLFHIGKYNEAEQLSLQVLEDYQNNNDIILEDEQTIFFYLSRIYQKKGEIEKAIYYAKEVLQNKPVLKQIILTYAHLSELYQQSGSFNLALQYKDSVIHAMDSLQKINDKSYLESNRIKFELFDMEKALAEKNARQKADRILFIVIILFIFVLAMISIWILRVRNNQRKKIMELELQQEKNQKLILKQQLKEKETLSLLEQEKFNNEIEAKNRQLTAKILSYSNKGEWIKEILHSLSSITDKSENFQLSTIIRELKLELTDSLDWDNFLTHFEQMNPLLLSSLKNIHPSLTTNDIQLLSCICLDLDTKKTAYLLNTSIKAYQKRKERLATKMGIDVMNMYDYLQSLVSK